MTKNRKAKLAARARKAETGESYTEARRNEQAEHDRKQDTATKNPNGGKEGTP